MNSNMPCRFGIIGETKNGYIAEQLHSRLYTDTIQSIFVPLQLTLDFYTLPIREFCNKSFQNLSENTSHFGFLFDLADENDHFNAFHWHITCPIRLFASTKK